MPRDYGVNRAMFILWVLHVLRYATENELAQMTNSAKGMTFSDDT